MKESIKEIYKNMSNCFSNKYCTVTWDTDSYLSPITTTIKLINFNNYTKIVEWNNNKWWYKNNKLHREDGPALVLEGGEEQWHINGQLHREDGPALVCCKDNIKAWYLYGKQITEAEHKETTK